MKNSTIDTVRDITDELKVSLAQVLDHLDQQALAEIVQLACSCTGVLFFTGVGKSGIIAKKIVVTLTSFGTKAMFLSAQDALHGDIGVVREGDIVFLLSKSGQTEELLHLCPALRNKGAQLVAVVSNAASRLVTMCDHAFVLAEVKELCPFDLIPTTSTLSQLIFGDILAVSLLRLKGIALEDYIQNHPSGRIGRRVLLKVADLMRSHEKVPKAFPQARVLDILHELSSKECGCVFIVDHEDHLLGVFTDGDLRRSIQKYNHEVFSKTLQDLMTHSPKTIKVSEKATEAIRCMEGDLKHPITVLAVLNNENKLVGAIKLHDLLQAGL